MFIVFNSTNYFVPRCFLRRTYHKLIKYQQNIPMPHSRDDPVITKLNDPLFHSLFTPELKILSELFKKRNYEIRIAGGAVRDILMGIKPTDLDFATEATPDEMKDMFNEENIRMINNKGEKHDGRRAEVEFIKNWKLDSLRRDFTVNSMFLDLEGKLYDHFFGYDDLQKRQIVFVGNPVNRIQEDYLRIFRYFRFYGRIAEQPDAHREEAIEAIKKNVHGLEQISGERIWSEWTKILSGNYAKEVTLKMLECGVGSYAGLPEEPNIENFKTVYDACKQNNVTLNPISYLALMLKNEDEAFNLHKRLKLSSFERDLAIFLTSSNKYKPSENLKNYESIFIHWKGNKTNCKVYICELLKCKQLFDLAEQFDKVIIPRFPISGHTLRQNIKNGKKIGMVLKELKDIWLDSNFKMTEEKLLQEVPRIIGEIEDKE
nr:CCA tRNA nucleotidyltransferase 1, mitochondrial isoform X2 [Nomia melanderi]